MIQQKGFTLIEVMISITIFVLIMITVDNIFSFSRNISSQSSHLAELIQNSRVATDRLSREARQAALLVTEISTSTPSHEIMFQDGHDLSQISYVKYRLDGTDLLRDNIYYYFSVDPSSYVYFDSVDAFGSSPLSTTTSQIIGEYFDFFNITNNEGLLHLVFGLEKIAQEFNIETDIFIRNW